MKKILLSVFISAFLVISVSSAWAQTTGDGGENNVSNLLAEDAPRTAYVDYVGYSWPKAKVNMPDGQIDIMNVPQKHIRYKFDNPANVNVKMVVYVPGSPFTDRLFGQSTPLRVSSYRVASAGKIKVKKIEERVNNDEKAFLEGLNSKPFENFKLRSSSPSYPGVPSNVYVEMSKEYEVSSTQDDDRLNELKGYMEEDNAVAVWESEVKSVVAGSQNETSFVFDISTNLNNIYLPVVDYVYYVLKDVDTNEILNIVQYTKTYRSDYGTYTRTFSVDNEKNTKLIEYYSTNATSNVYLFLVQKGWCVEYIDYSAIRNGPMGILEYIMNECSSQDVVAYPEVKDGKLVPISLSNAYSASYSTWNIKAPNGQPFTALNSRTGTRDFYMLTVFMDKTEEKTVGQEIPETDLFLDQITLPDPNIPVAGDLPPGYIPTSIKDVQKIKSSIVIYNSNGEIKLKTDDPELMNKQVLVDIFETNGQAIRQNIEACLNGNGIKSSGNKGLKIIRVRNETGEEVLSSQEVLVE